MLFNSYEFIFLFLIPVFAVYLLLSLKSLSQSSELKVWFFIFVSLVFYAQWSLEHLGVLLGSIAVNYLLARIHLDSRVDKKVILFIVVVLNLIPLLYYKYSDFLEITSHPIVLPLAISFFTFQQIAFGVDLYRGKIVSSSFRDYLFFVLFFPQLIAGPIVHYHYLVDQINGWGCRVRSDAVFAGVVLFSMGLFSKVVLADNLVKSSYDSWSDVFSYSFMIYFDFSGYANMAIGLALMFGIVLPINFNSPYKARNLAEFWRTWHITLSDFLKEHIYIPLGGNRFGVKKQIFALMSTMVIGGIWHGAGWNFLLWGAGHGVGLVFLVLLNRFYKFKILSIFGVIVTFLYVSLLWVLFFSRTLDDALSVYKILFSLDEFRVGLVDGVWLFVAAVVVWGFPNANAIINIQKKDYGLRVWHGYMAGALMFISLKFMAGVPSSDFVYFNF